MTLTATILKGLGHHVSQAALGGPSDADYWRANPDKARLKIWQGSVSARSLADLPEAIRLSRYHISNPPVSLKDFRFAVTLADGTHPDCFGVGPDRESAIAMLERRIAEKEDPTPEGESHV